MLCNLVCIVIYPPVFYKWFHVKKNKHKNVSSTANSNNDKTGSQLRGEFSCIIIGLTIFAANTLVTLYYVLTVYNVATGNNINAYIRLYLLALTLQTVINPIVIFIFSPTVREQALCMLGVQLKQKAITVRRAGDFVTSLMTFFCSRSTKHARKRACQMYRRCSSISTE